MPLPTISVITPSFNQAPFLPHCLSSVAGQTHKAIEHLVFDPGSTDGSRQIAAAAPGVTLVAEPDGGQADAVCKGLGRAGGDILAWLNSDDQFADADVFRVVATAFAEHPDVDVVYGKAVFVDENNVFIKDYYVNGNPDDLLNSFQYQVGVCQPSVFIRRRVHDAIGGPSIDLEYQLDFDYWIRIAQAGFKWHFLPRVLAKHRWWSGMKTAGKRAESLFETLVTMKKHFGYVHAKWAERIAQQEVLGNDGIVKTGQGEATADLAEVEARVLRVCNTDYRAFKSLSDPAAPHQVADTARRMEALGIPVVAPARRPADVELAEDRSFFQPEEAAWPEAWRPHRVMTKDGRHRLVGYRLSDEFHWLFDEDWYLGQLARSRAIIEHARATRRHEVCVVVGNGPSLNRSDLSLLGHADVIFSNFAYLSPALKEHGTYYTIVNHMVAEQANVELSRLVKPLKFFPYWLRPYLAEDPSTYFLNATTRDGFSTDVTDWVSWRSTVSYFNLQLAYSLGYQKVILIGFDHHYVQQSGLPEGATILQKTDDPNHFDPRYFRGKKWQAADVQKMEQMYLHAKTAFEADGREIVNCTDGGHLELFRRGGLAAELGLAVSAPPPVASPQPHFEPTPDFDEIAYLETNLDVAEHVAAGVFRSGLEHFLRYGRAEGRKGEPRRVRSLPAFRIGRDQANRAGAEGAAGIGGKNPLLRAVTGDAVFAHVAREQDAVPEGLAGRTVLCSLQTVIMAKGFAGAERVIACCWSPSTLLVAGQELHQFVTNNRNLILVLPDAVPVEALGLWGAVRTSILVPGHERILFVSATATELPPALGKAPERMRDLALALLLVPLLALDRLLVGPADEPALGAVLPHLPQASHAFVRLLQPKTGMAVA